MSHENRASNLRGRASVVIPLLCLAVTAGVMGAETPTPAPAPLPADALCLTGNAPAALKSRNHAAAGFYTYTEPMTTAPDFPIYWAGRQMQEPGLYAGWVPFNKGRLTDGNPATSVAWARFWTGTLGHDITFDLGKDYEIVRVIIMEPRKVSGLEALYLKSAGEPRYVCVADKQDLVAFDGPNFSVTGVAESVFDRIGQSARWVRVQCRFKSGTPSEIQIWGREMAPGKTPARVPYLQDGGATPVQKPQSRPVSYSGLPPVFPVPKELALKGDALPLKNGLKISYEPAGSERARITAEVLRDELKECYGIATQVAAAGANATGDVLIGEAANSPLAMKAIEAAGQHLTARTPGPEGYVLVADARGVTIGGSDPAGAFYGAQTLLSLIRREGAGWAVPGAIICDWPDMSVRYIQGRAVPNKDLIRALARFRINYYMPNASGLSEAAKCDALAARYFVTFVPSLDFNALVLAKDPNLVERSPAETPEKLGVGRRNANPNHPKSWEIYEAECKTWLPRFHGDLVDICWDETYQSSRGSRWNVSAESRALDLSAGPLLAHTLSRIDMIFKSFGNKKILMQDTAFLHHKLSYPGDPDPDWNKALDLMPKDVTFLVWHPEQTGALLKGKGFREARLILDEFDWRKLDLPGPYSGFAAYMAESAFTPAKLIELAGVAWNAAAPRPQDPVAVASVARAVTLWNALCNHIVMPSQFARPSDFTPLDMSKEANRSRVDDKPADGAGWVDLGANCDLRALPAGRLELGGVPFQIIDETKNAGRGFIMLHNRAYVDRSLPSSADIPTPGLKAAALIFLHCLDNRPGHNYLRRKELAGYYFMVYDDHTYAKCEIKYAVNTANWDGRPTHSGYNPKGHSMTHGWLAWEGDTLSGMPAFLYATEWVNPKPDRQIVKIIFRAAYMPGNMNPMLLAVTAVNPSLAAPAPAATWPAALLDPAQPAGKPLDLSGGKDESELRYVAPDGTVLSAGQMDNAGSDKGIDSGILYRSYAGIVNQDGLQAARTDALAYAFPAPRPIAGALVTAAYRAERKTEDFGAARYTLLLESSDDGKTWTPESSVRDVSPEEHGPAWLAVKSAQVRQLRVRAQPHGSAQGFASIRLFQR